MDLYLRTKIEIAAALVFLDIIWQVSRPKYAPAGSTVAAASAPELKGSNKQEINPERVQVYAAPAKGKLKLPPTVQDDPNKYVLDSSKLPNDTHTHTVTTVLDQQTGQIETFDRRDPYPLLAAEQTGSAWIAYGLTNDGQKVLRLSVDEDVLQIKAAHFGILSTLDSNGRYFLGAGVNWRW